MCLNGWNRRVLNVFLRLMKTIFVLRDLSYNNLSGPVPKSPARTFKYGYYATATVSLWLLCRQLLYLPWFCFLFHICLISSSIVGNPLICGTSSNEGCFGSVTLVPPSSFLESSPGNALKSKPSSGFRPSLFFSLTFVY